MSSDTSVCPGLHVKRSVKRKSGPFSLRRVNWISNAPDAVEQREASVTRTPVQVRCRSRASEVRAPLSTKAGLHSCWAAVGSAPHRRMALANIADRGVPQIMVGLYVVRG